MNLEEALKQIEADETCQFIPATSNYRCSFELPADLQAFYQVCNGLDLFKGSPYPYRILGIEELQFINLLLIGELCPEDRSSQWICIARDDNGDYLSMDLSLERLGWCYDSFHETHGLVGDTPVIAKSFTELLDRLFETKGERLYWFESDFKGLYGDAYDGDNESGAKR